MPQDFFTASSTRTKQPPISEGKTRPMVDEWTMYDYLNKYEKYATNRLYPEERKEFAKIWAESGKPHIIPETEQENLDYNIKWGYDPEITDSDDKYQKTWRTTAHMRYGKNHYDPDTLFIPDSPWKSRDFDAEDMLDKLIAELAHSFHKQHTKLLPSEMAWIGKNKITIGKTTEQDQYDAYVKKSGEDWKNYGYDEYDVEGAIEHDVHELIEPSLWDRIYEVQDKADRYSF